MILHQFLRPLVLGVCLLVATSAAAENGFPVSADPYDWPNWRGPEQNNTSRETGLIDSWDPFTGENVLWNNEELATRSTPIVMGDRLYVLCRSNPGTTKEGEQVVCADAATGKIIWRNVFNVYLSDVPDTRVGWSSVTADPATGRLYALGVCGYFQCIDAKTGKTIWSRSLSEEFGVLSTYGGRTNVPVVFDDVVIISGIVINWGKTARRLAPGEKPTPPTPADEYLAFNGTTGGKGDMPKPAHRFLGFDKTNGELVWFNGTRLLPDDTTYSTPTIAVINGEAQMIFGGGDGKITSMQPRTGKILWTYDFARRGLNVSPLVVGSTVYSGQSEENLDFAMGGVVALDATKRGEINETGELWRLREVMSGKGSPLMVDGKLLIATDSGSLHLFDPKSGEEIGRRAKLIGTILRATPLYADGKIYACTTGGWHVLEVTDDGLKLVNRMRFTDGDEVYGSPIVSHGRIYLPTTGRMFCLGTKDHKPAITPRPPQPKEASVSEDETPTHLQLVPAEVLLKPGEKQQFVARLFNSRGQFLRETKAAFGVDANGEVSQQGVFTAASNARHVAATVSARFGPASDNLAGFSRVRIVPDLPWKFDFTGGEVPITWVGCRYRHQVRDEAGEKLLVKITTIPKGTRSQGWMGHPDLSNYTIQADVRGTITDNKMPDIGLVAQRYTLDLQGANQQLQIRSWTTQLEQRFAVNVPFEWKPDTWYTMKFRAAVEDGQAVLRGKIWPRGTAEPAEWTIEGADAVPNVNGSPGLYGNAKDAELFYDNITVVKN